jgi:two-component system sensor histidine kinase KdpD
MSRLAHTPPDGRAPNRRTAARPRRQRAVLDRLREREAALLAGAASAILAGHSLLVRLRKVAGLFAEATDASTARMVLEAARASRDGEITIPLHCSAAPGWLYASEDCRLTRPELERIAGPLGRLVDVALERDWIADPAAEAEGARRAEVAKTAILHAISHDLRSPLTAMTTAGAALKAPGVTDAERDELIDVIEAEGVRLARLVDDLLDLSKIQAHALQPHADCCDLHDAAASAAMHQQGESLLEFALPGDLPLVRADAAQLIRRARARSCPSPGSATGCASRTTRRLNPFSA